VSSLCSIGDSHPSGLQAAGLNRYSPRATRDAGEHGNVRPIHTLSAEDAAPIILVDTSIGIDHGRWRDAQFVEWLTEGSCTTEPAEVVNFHSDLDAHNRIRTTSRPPMGRTCLAQARR